MEQESGMRGREAAPGARISSCGQPSPHLCERVERLFPVLRVVEVLGVLQQLVLELEELGLVDRVSNLRVVVSHLAQQRRRDRLEAHAVRAG